MVSTFVFFKSWSYLKYYTPQHFLSASLRHKDYEPNDVKNYVITTTTRKTMQPENSKRFIGIQNSCKS